jgi:hypothetical protein
VSGPLEELAETLRADGGLLADAVRDAPGGEPLPAGPRPEVRFLLEAIREGELLHYGRPRVVATPDPDLALLAGDRLYALGLERLAALGDLTAVRALADVISACARAHAEQRPELAEQAWADGAGRVHGAAGPEPGAQAARAGGRRAYSSER